MITENVIVAVIGLFGVLASSYVAYLKVKKTAVALKQAENEIKLQQTALSFGSFIEEWSQTHKEIKELLETTCLDRFLILRAWNGKLAPRWTTALFQMRLGNQKPISYVHFELDVDYVSRLRDISISNVIHFKVDDLPDCAIKKVYQAEGVTSAVWLHLISEELSGTGTVAHTYCSLATHADEAISEEVVTRCVILAGRLKGIAMQFNSMPN